MGFEYAIRFAEAGWLRRHRDDVLRRLRSCPRYRRDDGDDGVWLGDGAPPGDDGGWDVPVRVEPDADRIYVCDWGGTPAFVEDVRDLFDDVSRQTVVEITEYEDDVALDPADVFGPADGGPADDAAADGGPADDSAADGHSEEP